HRDQLAVVALPHGRIEIDELHQRILREPLDPVIKIVEAELEFFALDKLDDLAAHEVDGRNQHEAILSGCRLLKRVQASIQLRVKIHHWHAVQCLQQLPPHTCADLSTALNLSQQHAEI